MERSAHTEQGGRSGVPRGRSDEVDSSPLGLGSCPCRRCPRDARSRPDRAAAGRPPTRPAGSVASAAGFLDAAGQILGRGPAERDAPRRGCGQGRSCRSWERHVALDVGRVRREAWLDRHGSGRGRDLSRRAHQDPDPCRRRLCPLSHPTGVRLGQHLRGGHRHVGVGGSGQGPGERTTWRLLDLGGRVEAEVRATASVISDGAGGLIEVDGRSLRQAYPNQPDPGATERSSPRAPTATSFARAGTRAAATPSISIREPPARTASLISSCRKTSRQGRCRRTTASRPSPRTTANSSVSRFGR